jgi:superfamily I DNA and/or RNA helicase
MSKIYDLILDSLLEKSKNFEPIEKNIDYKEYVKILQNNIVLEVACSLKQNNIEKNKMKVFGKVMKDGTIKLNTKTIKLTNTVVKISDLYYFVTSCDLNDETGCIFLKLYPKPEFNANVESVNIICLKYVGNYLHQLSSLFYIESNYVEYKSIMSSFLNPTKYISGQYTTNENDAVGTVDENCNDTQLMAITNLKNNIELIHGPPGTGKSTTIINILNLKIPMDHNVLCTAVQNQAIESIVIKLENSNINFVVIGEDDRLKEVSKKYTLNKYYAKSEIIKKLNMEIIRIKKDVEIVGKLVLEDKKNEMNELKKKYNVTSDRLSNLYDAIYFKIKEKEVMIENEKKVIMETFRIFICTIDTSYKFYGMLPNSKKISTVILDEAGSTKESDMLPLLRLCPKNIILIGDPKQLSAFCDLRLDDNQKKILVTSVLERLMKSGRKHSVLTIQYRMKSDMCKIVSKLFYDNILLSDESRKVITTQKTGLSMKWVDVKDYEQYDEKMESYYNGAEIEEIIKLCNKHMGEEIMILTSYNAQLKELGKLLENSDNILVRTIDASQGSESSIVILSLTRSNKENKIGFLSDAKRMCVALSRAKNSLYIVGNKETFLNCGHIRWNSLVKFLDKY